MLVLLALVFPGTVLGQRLPPGWPADAPRSTTGPTRPADQEAEARRSAIRRFAITNPVIVSNVPPYLYYRGCGPTAEGMVIGYWDGQGYTNLVSGIASTQTASVNGMIASQGNYDDYWLPVDTTNTVVPDASETNAAGCHEDDSVADFMRTSRSILNNCAGWSRFSEADDGLTNYVRWKEASYNCRAENVTWGSGLWARFCSEIGSNHPAVLLIDTDTDGYADHFVAGIGYGTDGVTNMYACYDTWDAAVHWYSFTNMAAGRPYGIYGATFFTMIGGPPKATNPVPAHGALGVATNTSLSWDSSPGAMGYDVYFGTNPAPGAAEFQGSQAGTSYDPGPLGIEQLCYWRIDATNLTGTTVGDVWQFTTIPAHETHYVSLGGSNVWPYTSWANASTTIQAAVTAAGPCEVVLVTNGVYRQGARISIFQNIRVESTNGADVTIIDGQYQYPCLFLSNGVVSGFTIRNGTNTAASGGGVYFSLGGTVENCKVVGNIAGMYGGGAYLDQGGELRNCLVVSNIASRGGGAYLISGGLVGSSTLCGNTGTSRGGGVYISGAGMIRNSIIYYNASANGSNFYNTTATASYTNCCASPVGMLEGSGNISGPPGFVDYAAGDLHLASTSACVNAGTNDVWMEDAVEVDGQPRVMRGIVDIGADEYVLVPVASSCARSNGNAVVSSWCADTGSLYRLQANTDVRSLLWNDVSGVLTADCGTITLTHTNGTSPATFYRAVLLVP
ncbi:MAG: hypothetical protein V1873_09115 [Verrucomicrobiota bacterium]